MALLSSNLSRHARSVAISSVGLWHTFRSALVRCQSNQQPVTIRQARRDDFPTMSRILISSGLVSETVEYLNFHTAVDPDCLSVAEIVENGQLKVVGCAQGCVFTDDIGFLNLLAVDENYRRRGIAKQLAEYRLKRLGDRNLVSNIVPNALENLKKFTKPIECFAVNFNAGSTEKFTELQNYRLPKNTSVYSHEKILFDELLLYDSSIHVIPRPRILRLLLNDPQSNSFVCVCDEKIVGFVRLYHGDMTEVCLYADDDNIARSLLGSVSPIILQKQKKVMMSSLGSNQAANDLLNFLGLNLVFSMTRIYTKQEIILPVNKVYGLSNVGYFLT